jgi:hypothetical protein
LCPNQAFAYENAYGLLFHLELTPEMVQGLAEADREWTHENFDLDEGKLLEEARDLASLMKRQCYTLLDNFFDVGGPEAINHGSSCSMDRIQLRAEAQAAGPTSGGTGIGDP